jgi:hypothetical protein
MPDILVKLVAGAGLELAIEQFHYHSYLIVSRGFCHRASITGREMKKIDLVVAISWNGVMLAMY